MTKRTINCIATFFLGTCFSFMCILQVNAQVPSWVHPSSDELIPGQFQSNDSLNEVDNDAVIVDSMAQEKISFENVSVPTFEDSVYNSRIRMINTELPLVYNQDVRRYIDLYVIDRRDQVQRMLGLSKIYFPVFDQIFAEKGVPLDLKYLSIIESALNPQAVSRAGAVGMWQFMSGTALLYGLHINSYVDERRDIIRSTEGAAQYLKNMYDVYGDWLLALASYNCGPGNVNKAISLSGGNTFWEISDYLPRETRNYVPAFIAATYVMNYYDLHDLYPEFPTYCFDSIACVETSDRMTVDQLAKFLDMPIDEVKFLNPGLKSNVIPSSETTSYSLKLPGDKLEQFELMRDTIVMASQNEKTKFTSSVSSGSQVTYTVRRGESLGIIASKYHTSVAQLKSWNNLHSNLIYPGQKLKVYGTKTSTSSTTSSNTSTPSNTTSKTQTTTSSSGNVVFYKVKYGDSLWSIAKKYGTTIDNIRVLNGSKCDNLKAGTVLKVTTKG